MIGNREAQDSYWDVVACQKRFGHPLLTAELEKRAGIEGRILDYGCG